MFTVKKSALQAALSLTSSIVERKGTIPVLQNVLFERWPVAGSDRLMVKLTNLDVEAQVPFSAEIDKSFAPFTIPAGLLSDIVNKLPDESDIKVTVTDRDAKISCGRSKFSLPVLPATDFPPMKVESFPHELVLKASALAAAIDQVSFAISTEETRHYLNGIFLHALEAGLALVATDGHRLSKRLVMAAEGLDTNMPGVILPRYATRIFGKVLPKEGDVTLRVCESLVQLLAGDTTLTTKLIDGTFPDYQRVIPRDQTTTVEIDLDNLKRSVDRVATMANGKSNAMKFSFAEEALTLSVRNPDSGDAEDELTFTGDADIQIGFNGKYVAEALSQLHGDIVSLAMSDSGSPAILRARSSQPDDLIVLMPMRI